MWKVSFPPTWKAVFWWYSMFHGPCLKHLPAHFSGLATVSHPSILSYQKNARIIFEGGIWSWYSTHIASHTGVIFVKEANWTWNTCVGAGGRREKREVSRWAERRGPVPDFPGAALTHCRVNRCLLVRDRCWHLTWDPMPAVKCFRW